MGAGVGESASKTLASHIQCAWKVVKKESKFHVTLCYLPELLWSWLSGCYSIARKGRKAR